VKKFVFRCDGANLPEIGTGHVVRDVAIAKRLVETGLCQSGEVSFVMRVGGSFRLGRDLVADAGFKIEDAADRELAWNSSSEAKILKKSLPTVLVVDRLSTESSWMRSLKTSVRNIITMDDLGDGAPLATITVNAILYGDSANSNCLTGYDYLALKPMPKLPTKIKAREVKSIVASFGGYDHRNLAGFFLSSLYSFESNLLAGLSIEVLVGKESEARTDSWVELAERTSSLHDCNIRLLIQSENFAQHLAKADLAILSGGLTIFDALSLGIPSIGIPQYDHQLATLQRLFGQRAVLIGSIGMRLDERRFVEVLIDAIGDQGVRMALSKRGPALVDRKGIDRIVALLSDFIS